MSVSSKLGWIGALLLTLCALPEMLLAITRGHANGLSWVFLMMWYLGEICILVPAVLDIKKKYLTASYVCNILMLTVIIYYKIIG